ncbi:MAG: VapC toxin family PIN domain ribonuclease [Verrucomicrobiota bacterium]|nr:VapC toxin family PIN domain ribonuclease [Verrucomicrobiota bacterium]
MILGLDANILLYALNPSSAWHQGAEKFLKQNFGVSTIRVVIADYVLTELYVLLRNPAVMAHPLSAKMARDLVVSYWKIPNVMRLENAPIMDGVWAMAGNKDFSRRQIFDARLGLTMRHSGVTHFATTNVKDFKALGFEKVWNPLAD